MSSLQRPILLTLSFLVLLSNSLCLSVPFCPSYLVFYTSIFDSSNNNLDFSNFLFLKHPIQAFSYPQHLSLSVSLSSISLSITIFTLTLRSPLVSLSLSLHYLYTSWIFFPLHLSLFLYFSLCLFLSPSPSPSLSFSLAFSCLQRCLIYSFWFPLSYFSPTPSKSKLTSLSWRKKTFVSKENFQKYRTRSYKNNSFLEFTARWKWPIRWDKIDRVTDLIGQLQHRVQFYTAILFLRLSPGWVNHPFLSIFHLFERFLLQAAQWSNLLKMWVVLEALWQWVEFIIKNAKVAQQMR